MTDPVLNESMRFAADVIAAMSEFTAELPGRYVQSVMVRPVSREGYLDISVVADGGLVGNVTVSLAGMESAMRTAGRASFVRLTAINMTDSLLRNLRR